jgi:hypothetical protein
MATDQEVQAAQLPPVYNRLKDLHRDTMLVWQGVSQATIVAPVGGIYDEQANQIQQAIAQRSGTEVPIVTDDTPAAGVPIVGHLIVLGNRSTNRTIAELYNRYFTLLDLRYPGPGGSVVRSLHNPFGGGHNVILVGGSDTSGVDVAAGVFADRIAQADAVSGSLAVGWLMEIRLGTGTQLPEDIRDFETWEASAGYGSIGYFGWNSISKRMAMYYMTGVALHAREALRLAFPDEEALKEITEIDGERIENKNEPLSGPYHYNAHMMVLYWDLIEESPVFSDDERLRVINALSQQFSHAQDENARRRIIDSVHAGRGDRAYAEPPPRVGSRHDQWSAISLYCLGRYFHKDDPHPLWEHSMKAARWHFASLHHHAWIGGENDNLFWYNTGIAPVLSYMLLTGDRELIRNGVLATLVGGQQILASGREPDWALQSASIGLLNKAAYLLQDGRYREYLRRTGMDLDIFRLGQSFWPEEDLTPRLATDLMGRWSTHPISEPMWRHRASGLPLEHSFLFSSYRSAADASGDFILLKGMNGASRNAYHTFAILELRLAGTTLLEGYLNQVLTRADGMVQPEVAMDAALRHRDVVGDTVVAVGETPGAAFCNWRRTLLQRVGQYALIVDDLSFSTHSTDMEIEILWQGKSAWQALPGGGAVGIDGAGEIHLSDPIPTDVSNGQARMVWQGAVEPGDRQIFFSLVAGEPSAGGRPPLACTRLCDHAAALALPQPAVAAVGSYDGLEGEMVVLAHDHLHGVQCTQIALGGTLFAATTPVHVDWDFHSNTLEVVAAEATRIHLAIAPGAELRVEGEVPISGSGAMSVLDLSAGRHRITGAVPDGDTLAMVRARLVDCLDRAQEARQQRAATTVGTPLAGPSLTPAFTASVGGVITNLVIASTAQHTRICATVGSTVHVLSGQGAELRRLQADGPIRVLHWWAQPALLLAGCVDEQVIAFDVETGERRWVFVSEEDPAVFRAAKPYWFKSAPGHAGVHGLHTGLFLDGREQAFVGSACTLEMLDENGTLVRRLPVFWGPGSQFALVDGPDDSINLLIARQPTDSHALAVVNNRRLDPKQRGFAGVPAGHTNIGGWACMSRKHIFYEDLDGDGVREVVSEINGTWNRVTVWAPDGTPLHSVQLGPGPPIPTDSVQDFDVADLHSDGRKVLLAATPGGLVLALNHACERLWSRRLPSPPTVLSHTGAGPDTSRVVAGCVDGTVVVLDGKGEVRGTGRCSGKPTCIERLDEHVVLATDGGQITRWMPA